ncbi:MAG TPA: PAS domain S-box protein [Acidimicrobiia bacterium]|nr:PAS domain S-box protein [Acidimicrobiia bacterium]
MTNLAVDLSMVDEAPVGLGLCDADGRFLEISDGLAAILGRRAAEVVGLHYSEVVHPDDRAAAHGRMVKFMVSAAGRLRHEERYLRPDGDVRWVNVVTTRIIDRPDSAASAVLRVVDITPRRRAEFERDRVTAMLAEAQAIAHVGSWEYDFATQRTTCSNQLLRILGLEKATEAPDITPLFDWIHVADRQAVREAAWESFESGVPFSVECRITRADGAERIVHVQGRFSADPVGHDRLIGTLQDVTAQRCAEARLRESQARFRAIFENAPMGIATVDRSLQMLNVNAALTGMLGEAPERLIGRTLVDITHPDDIDRVREVGRKTMAGEIPGYDIEQRFVGRGGGDVWARVRATLPRGAAGEAGDGFVLIEDITPAKEAERARLEIDSLRQLLLGRLSSQERHILEHMAAGRTNRQIAEELALAEKTVRNYVSNLLAKLGMRRRSEAAAFAARLEERGQFGPR